jgi:uncharacterized protein YecE (DUF72 family)
VTGAIAPGPGGLRVGTSGWQYADWRGLFYPAKLPQREWLATYASEFDTVEINATFYRLPSVTAVQRWADTLPANFVVATKMSRYLTHVKRLNEPAEPVQRMWGVLAPLRQRGILGPVLVQLPPDLPIALDRLERTLQAFPAGAMVAVEPRHETWFVDELRELLSRHRAALVWADRGGKPLGPTWLTADWCYLRLHKGRTDWRYDAEDLQRWADQLAAAGAGFAYANNDPGGAAITDARLLRAMLACRDDARRA